MQGTIEVGVPSMWDMKVFARQPYKVLDAISAEQQKKTAVDQRGNLGPQNESLVMLSVFVSQGLKLSMAQKVGFMLKRFPFQRSCHSAPS